MQTKTESGEAMDETMMLAYADLRAHRLMLNGAQRILFRQKVLDRWLHGEQAETCLTEAAKEVER